MWELSEQVTVDAPPTRVWELVTDVARHPELAGSGEILALRFEGPLAVGASWDSDERIRAVGRFTARSTCVTLDPPHEFGWRSYPPPIRAGRDETVAEVDWWFRLTPAGDGTRLDHGVRIVEPAVAGWMMRLFYTLTRRASTIRRGMRGTLRNIQHAAETSPTITGEPR